MESVLRRLSGLMIRKLVFSRECHHQVMDEAVPRGRRPGAILPNRLGVPGWMFVIKRWRCRGGEYSKKKRAPRLDLKEDMRSLDQTPTSRPGIALHSARRTDQDRQSFQP